MRHILGQFFLNLYKRKKLIKDLLQFIMLALVCSLAACSSADQSSQTESCPIPIDFKEKDLIGTWQTGLSEMSDTLILKEDRTYKQIIHVKTPAFDYESDWLPWSLKLSDSGIPYLYLEEMRLCLYWEGKDCQNSGGGKDDWYDFCKKEWVQMPDEGILIVLGPPKGVKLASPGISLFALQRSTEGTTVYEKQKP